MCFWDTAGQEKYRNLVKCYLKGCDAVVYVFSFDNRDSLIDIGYWFEEVSNVCDNGNIIEMILCNKTDIP